jgi:hypothetical protein
MKSVYNAQNIGTVAPGVDVAIRTSLIVHNIHTTYSNKTPNIHTTYTQHTHNILTTYTQHTHNIHTTYSQHTHNILTTYSHHTHMMSSSLKAAPYLDTTYLVSYKAYQTLGYALPSYGDIRISRVVIYLRENLR